MRNGFPNFFGTRLGVTADLFNVFNYQNLDPSAFDQMYSINGVLRPTFGKGRWLLSDPRRFSSAWSTTSDRLVLREDRIYDGAPAGSTCEAAMNRERRVISSIWGMLAAVVLLQGCGGSPAPAPAPVANPSAITERERAFLDTLERRTFAFFWDHSDSVTGLTPDRWPSPSFSSIAAVGFALTAYPIGIERGYVSRADAAERVLRTLRFFWEAPQGPAPTDVSGYHGFFYHFLDMQSGRRYRTVELSTIDTALLLGGTLFCQSYFDGSDGREAAIRSYAESLYARVDWRWAQANYPLISHGWTPEAGFITYDWSGYNEAMLVYLLALGSPTRPIGREAWDTWTQPYEWDRHFGGLEHVGFGPMFGHQYTHVWIDFRGIQDAYMRARGIDYFENSRRQTYAQRAYAIANSPSTGVRGRSSATLREARPSPRCATTAPWPRPPQDPPSLSPLRSPSRRWSRCASATATACSAATGFSTPSIPRSGSR